MNRLSAHFSEVSGGKKQNKTKQNTAIQLGSKEKRIESQIRDQTPEYDQTALSTR